MNRTAQKLINWIFPAVVFFLVFAIDVQLVNVTGDTNQILMIRDLLLGLALILMIWGSARSPWLEQRSLMQKLRLLGLIFFLFWILEMVYTGPMFGVRPLISISP